MNRSRLIPLAVFAVLALVLGGSALAWACTPQASITISPNSGPPGSGATVNGSAFTSGPVSIRWNSATGEELTTATGPNFSVHVNIPSYATDDVYYVVAVAGTYKASTPFEVVSPSSEEGGSQEESGGSGSSSGTTSGGESSGSSGSGSTSGSASGGQGSSEPSSGSEPSGSGSSSSSTGSSSGSTSGSSSGGQTSGSSQGTSGGISARSGFGGPAAGPTTTGAPASSNPLKVRTASGDVVFGGSLGPAAKQRESASRQADGTGASKAQAGSSGSSAFGDLWGGFDSDSSGSLIPGLGDLVDPGPGQSSQLIFGMALLGVGLVALSGGFLVAATRRRRAAAEVDTR